MLALIKIPLSWIYAIIITIRNLMYDWGIKKSVEHNIPIVCVGNLTVGGTGKTPHTEMLVEMLSKNYNVAIISRGYKRKSHGYYEVQTSSSTKMTGDEPKQMKIHFPNIPIAVCEDRNTGIRILRKKYPEVTLILMDDGFQHRSTETWLNIILTDHSHPYYKDSFLPWGNLRDNAHSVSRAQIVIVTKTPPDIKPINLRIITKDINLYPYQDLFFTTMAQSRPMPIFNSCQNVNIDSKSKVIAVAGIARPDSFFQQLDKKFHIVEKLGFSDHHNYNMRNVQSIEKLLKEHGDNTIVIMTEKDAVKFASSKKIDLWLQERMFKVAIEVQFINTDNSRNNTKEFFESKIMPYVTKNQKHNTINY